MPSAAGQETSKTSSIPGSIPSKDSKMAAEEKGQEYGDSGSDGSVNKNNQPKLDMHKKPFLSRF